MYKATFLLQALTLSCLVGLVSSAYAAEKRIYGVNEKVFLAEVGVQLDAKLDTGAQTASLSAKQIEYFEQDNQPWVRFHLATDNAPPQAFELPLARVSKIKRRSGDYQPDIQRSYIKRPVVTMTVTLGSQQHAIEVNLTDRSRFKYPVLIGANALQQFNAIVDPSVEYVAEPPLNTSEHH